MNKIINISSGHGKYVKGAGCYIDEVTEARKVVDRVAQLIKERGCTARVFHENASKDKNTNLKNIVAWHNNQKDGIDLSVHFNACYKTDKAMGVEVLHGSPKEEASNLSKAVAQAGGFKNRGGKSGSHLYFIKNTKKKSMLIEVCFVDSKADVELYKKNFEAICEAIASSLTGINKVVEQKPSNDNVSVADTIYRVVVGSYANKDNATKMVNELVGKGYKPFIDVVKK